jgi:HEAT repeat protein
MSNGDKQDTSEEVDTGSDEIVVDVDQEELEARLDAATEAIETAETEGELDDAEADVDAVVSDLDAAALPESDDDTDPVEVVQTRIEEVQDELAEARGPYGEDVIEEIETAQETIETGEWTDQGEDEVATAVEAFREAVTEQLDLRADANESSRDAQPETLKRIAEAVATASFDADEDAEDIATLLDATDALATGLDEAQQWADLTVVQQMRAEGFYDRLNSRNRKDFPPELSVVRIAEKENDPQRVLMAMDYLTSQFMQENCVEALKRMGSPEAYDALMQKVGKRDVDAIEAIGKMGAAASEATETLHTYIDGESNPPLQKVTLRALGEIGSQESTQPAADRLVAEDPEVRSQAAHALGRLGDTRAIGPLADVLAEDTDNSVRAAAAWALNAIGTERALKAAATYVTDRSYLVQAEAETAHETLGRDEPEPEATA